MIETIEIQKNRVKWLVKRIEKLNKKAVKLNCPEMVLTIGTDERVVEVKNDFTGMTDHVEVLVDATLEYEIPVIDGYELICTFDIVHTDNEPFGCCPVVFTSKVPDKTIPVEYLDKHELHCDHCGYKRNRNHSMLMKKVDTGEHIEVGSTCIKDFFGHDPKAFMWMAQFSFGEVVDDADKDCVENGGSYSYAFSIQDFLATTNACINDAGWVSKGVAYDKGMASTADMVLEQMLGGTKPHGWVRLPIIDDDKKMADDTIDYFLNLDVEDNDYLTNCKKIAGLGYVPNKHTGVACSMVATYKRSYEDKLRREAHGTSDYVGDVGDKLEVAVECVFEIDVNSMYGMSILFIFVDENGNKYKTFYSGNSWACETGDKVNLKGTVKKHEEYKGEKATMLTRCKVTK